MGYVSPFYKEVEKIKKSIDKGNAPLNFRDLSEKNQDMFWTALTETCGEGIMPFLISTRMQYSSLEDIIKNKDQIVFIANDEKTVWELFQMFLFHKIDQRNPFLNINFEEYIKIVYDDIDHLIQEVINQNLHIWQSEDIYYVLTNLTSEYDKKKLGSVHTPMKLVQEIFDHIPEEGLGGYILDPACGDGTFLFEAKKRLMKIYGDMGCKSHNFIYGVDIDPKKCYITSALLDPRGECESNIYLGNSLDKEFMGEVMKKFDGKFDVIVSNYPYQAPQDADGKRGGGDLLWHKFLETSYDTLEEGGILAVIHPAGWRKPQSKNAKYNKAWEYLTEKMHIQYLAIHNTEDGKKTFNAGTRYDWYIAEKKKNNETSIVRGEDGIENEIDFREIGFLPNMAFDSILPLLVDNEESCDIIYSGSNYESRKPWVSENKNDEFCFPLIHSTPKSGIRYMYSSHNDKGHFGISKVIFGDSGIYSPVIDMEGKYGMTQHAMAIPVKDIEDANKLVDFLTSDEFSKILKACSWSNFSIDWRLFTYFKDGFWR